MKQRHKAIVLGAGYAGLGYLSTHPDCLLLEEGQTVGGDFHATLRPCREAFGEPGVLADALRENDVLKQDGFDFLKASLVAHRFAARLMERGKKLCLDAQLLSVEAQPDGVAVRYFTNEGEHVVMADSLVDATPEGISCPDALCCVRKWLNVFTVCNTPDFEAALKSVCPDCKVFDGLRPQERFVMFPVPLEMNLPGAGRLVADTWRRAFPNGNEKILFMAQNFDAQYKQLKPFPWNWIGQRCTTLTEAFEKGAKQK